MGTQPLDTGAATLFNTHMMDAGNRLGTFCNFLLLVDGGILSITIGAFIGPTPPAVPSLGLFAIQVGWCLLTIGLVLALTTTFVVLMAQLSVQMKLRRSFTPNPTEVKLHTGPEWLARLIRVVLILAFLTSVAGISTVSYGAVQMLKPPSSAPK